MRRILSIIALISLFFGGVAFGVKLEYYRAGAIGPGEFLLWPTIWLAVWAVLTWLKKKIELRKQTVDSFK